MKQQRIYSMWKNTDGTTTSERRQGDRVKTVTSKPIATVVRLHEGGGFTAEIESEDRVTSGKARDRRPRPRASDVRIGSTELAARLGVHRLTLDRWVHAGTFPPPHYIGTRRKWLITEVDAWEAAQRALPPRTTARNLPDRGQHP